MTVLVTENYGGYFELRLCADKSEAEQLVTQECLDRNLSKIRKWINSLLRTRKIANTTIMWPLNYLKKMWSAKLRYPVALPYWSQNLGICEDGTFRHGMRWWAARDTQLRWRHHSLTAPVRNGQRLTFLLYPIPQFKLELNFIHLKYSYTESIDL